MGAETRPGSPGWGSSVAMSRAGDEGPGEGGQGDRRGESFVLCPGGTFSPLYPVALGVEPMDLSCDCQKMLAPPPAAAATVKRQILLP